MPALFSQNVPVFMNELSGKRISTRLLLSKWALDCSSEEFGPGDPCHLGEHPYFSLDTSKLLRDRTPLQCLASPFTPVCSARMGEDRRVSFTNSPGPFTAPATGVDSEDSLIQLVPVVLDTRVGGPENQFG